MELNTPKKIERAQTSFFSMDPKLDIMRDEQKNVKKNLNML